MSKLQRINGEWKPKHAVLVILKKNFLHSPFVARVPLAVMQIVAKVAMLKHIVSGLRNINLQNRFMLEGSRGLTTASNQIL